MYYHVRLFQENVYFVVKMDSEKKNMSLICNHTDPSATVDI